MSLIRFNNLLFCFTKNSWFCLIVRAINLMLLYSLAVEFAKSALHHITIPYYVLTYNHDTV